MKGSCSTVWFGGVEREVVDSGLEGTTRVEDAQGTPTQRHVSPSILVYEEKHNAFPWGWNARKTDRFSAKVKHQNHSPDNKIPSMSGQQRDFLNNPQVKNTHSLQ